MQPCQQHITLMTHLSLSVLLINMYRDRLHYILYMEEVYLQHWLTLPCQLTAGSNWLVVVQGLGLADRCDWLGGRCNKRLKEVHEGGRMYPVHEES